MTHRRRRLPSWVAVASWVAIALGGGSTPADAQETEGPVLEGTVFVADTAMRRGTVVLHHLTQGGQGQLDSLPVAEDGSFAFPLPNQPDSARGDVYFASLRHQGVLYFGPAITQPVQLDSIYRIQAYDTAVASATGAAIPLQTRSVFFEPDSVGWRVTDLFQIRNDRSRTWVASPGGVVWSHPLPPSAQDVTTGQGELAFDAARYEDGSLVVRAAVPPGERLFVVRYRLESPLVTFANPQGAETMDVLIREPSPPLGVEGLDLVGRVELEAGSTYLHYSDTDVITPVAVVPGEEDRPPAVHWVAVILALVLAMAAVFLLRPRPATVAPVEPVSREELIRQVAELDERFDGSKISREEEVSYRRRRAELIARIKTLS